MIKDYYSLKDYEGEEFSAFSNKVLCLQQSLRESGLPKTFGKYSPEKAKKEDDEKLLTRGARLGQAPVGSGHDCFLKGIVVRSIFRGRTYWITQLMRYHFQDITSSQSTMHHFNDARLRDWEEITGDKNLIDYYDLIVEKKYEEFLNRCTPCELSFGFVTNYLQLKTVFLQRKNHKLRAWKEFIEWCESLPHFLQLIGESHVSSD